MQWAKGCPTEEAAIEAATQYLKHRGRSVPPAGTIEEQKLQDAGYIVMRSKRDPGWIFGYYNDSTQNYRWKSGYPDEVAATEAALSHMKSLPAADRSLNARGAKRRSRYVR